MSSQPPISYSYKSSLFTQVRTLVLAENTLIEASGEKILRRIHYSEICKVHLRDLGSDPSGLTIQEKNGTRTYVAFDREYAPESEFENYKRFVLEFHAKLIPFRGQIRFTYGMTFGRTGNYLMLALSLWGGYYFLQTIDTGRNAEIACAAFVVPLALTFIGFWHERRSYDPAKIPIRF